eukprot:6204034-Pleurochrysis_carterae.AAC.2
MATQTCDKDDKETGGQAECSTCACQPAASCRASCGPCRLLPGVSLCGWNGLVTGTAPAAAATRSQCCAP